MAALPYRTLHARLHRWYQAHGRHDLPWRTTQDPYRIYVSEIMLQQTQVKTVLERFYHPFLKKFPTLSALAKAREQEVLKAWEGLGYYTRARNLHKAAQATAPRLPRTVEALQALPGIGKNTACAVAAFAYHAPVPVMEANVKRILHRFFAAEKLSEATLWEHAFALLDTHNPFDYNQAMMDIGAMVCTAKAPKCTACPLRTECKGKHAPEHYPAPKTAKAKPVRRYYVLVHTNPRGELYLEKRETRLLHGTYRFPQTEQAPKSSKKLGQVIHHYSHFTFEGEVRRITTAPKGTGMWYGAKALRALPLSTLEKKVLALLEH